MRVPADEHIARRARGGEQFARAPQIFRTGARPAPQVHAFAERHASGHQDGRDLAVARMNPGLGATGAYPVRRHHVPEPGRQPPLARRRYQHGRDDDQEASGQGSSYRYPERQPGRRHGGEERQFISPLPEDHKGPYPGHGAEARLQLNSCLAHVPGMAMRRHRCPGYDFRGDDSGAVIRPVPEQHSHAVSSRRIPVPRQDGQAARESNRGSR
jgi:hypothetical protein